MNPRTDILGKYKDENTGEIYTVIKVTNMVIHTPVSGEKECKPGADDFFTECGKELIQVGKDLEAFEFGRTDGFIRRID